MPIYAQRESTELWTHLRNNRHHARSLAASRFVTIASGEDDKEWRRTSCEVIRDAVANPTKGSKYREFSQDLVGGGGGQIILAKLQGRMILNAAGGTFENGGICLDRTSGLPYVPGSAVKGVARAHALQIVADSESPEEKAKTLLAFCRVFGWANQEWQAGRSKADLNEAAHSSAHSDLWLAMVPLHEGVEADDRRNKAWETVAEEVAAELLAGLGKPLQDKCPARDQMPNCAGTVCFLPAFPDSDPGIDLDVLTPHHPDYYQGKIDVATDDESPNPVLFPVVRPGKTFAFPLLPNGSCRPADLDLAKDWLLSAIQIRGIGAKTNAGYGWFKPDSGAAMLIERELQLAKEKALSPAERIAKLGEQQFAELARDLADLSPEEQKAVCDQLTGDRSDQWKLWKKAKKWKVRLPMIRKVAEEHGIVLS